MKIALRSRMRPIAVGRYALLVALLWTVAMGVSLTLNLVHEDREGRDIALREARTQTDLDIAIRVWAASHGGVYAPVDSATPPNPYLAHIPERDITTPSGVSLTLMNPAYVLRQVMERMSALYGITARITSLDPIRPENAPDEWERLALDRLGRGGAAEVSEFVTEGGAMKLRFLRPFRAREDCLKCHGEALAGEVRGGISLTMPIEPLMAVHQAHSREMVVGHAFIWAIGIASLVLATARIGRDMRKRKAAEDALAESEERNRALVEAMPDIIFRLSREGLFLDAQAARDDMVMVPRESFVGMNIRDVMPPEVAGEALRHLALACETGEFRSFEYELAMGGETRAFEARIVRAGRDEAVAIVRDMTERKRAEEALARGHALLDAISNTQRLHISGASMPDVFEALLRGLLSLTGSEFGFVGEVLRSEEGSPYLKAHALAGVGWSEETRQAYAEHVARGLELRNPGALLGAVLATGEPVVENDPASDPIVAGLPAGHLPIRSFLGIPFHSGRRLVGMAALANRRGGYEEDVVVYLAPLARTASLLIESLRSDERRLEAERETAEGHRFLQTVIDSVSDPVMVIEEGHRVLLMNKSARANTGADRAGAAPLCHVISHRSDSPCSGDSHPCPLEEVRRTGRPMSVMHQHYNAEGSLRYHEISASPFIGPDGKFRGIIEVGRDVTDRVLSEKALKESEEKFRTLAEYSPNMIFINAMGRILYTNEKCTEVMGYTGAEFLASGFDFMTLVAPEDRELTALNFQAHASGEDVPPHEYRLLTKDGGRVEVIIATRLISYRGERAILGVITDITERKRIESDLERSLVEKEMLIKEVYHRVKNNLASVSSLLKLQSAQVEDARARELFVETQNRVKAMSMIHERLYRSGDLKSIDLPEYMRSIAVQLYRSYEITEAKARLHVDVEQVALGVDTMIPLGLILNELVTNALKHAFPGKETGTLTIELHARGGKSVFTVRDTGVGLPEGFDIRKTTSLGLRLVESLARQIQGELEISSEPGRGARFTIVF